MSIQSLADDLAPQTLLARVQRVWKAAVGEALAAEATPTGESGGTLRVTCSSSVWAQELDLMSGEIRAQLNAKLGGEEVLALRCSAAPPRRWASEG